MGNNLQLFETHAPEGFHDAEWSTPPTLFRGLDEEFHFTLDVCASPSNAKCDRYFTIHEDGLSRPWAPSICWMNPPYTARVIDRWMKKAWEESRGGATVVCLVPSSTSCGWWHNYAMRGELRFIRGRLKFGGVKGEPTFSNTIVIFRPPIQPQ